MSIDRPVMTTVLVLALLIFGAISYTKLTLNMMPEIEIPFTSIVTIYPGAGPKEIETQVSKKIEDAVATVSGIKNLTSFSLDGASILIIEFRLGKDVDVAYQEVKAKVDAVRNELPDDAELPVVQKIDMLAFPIVDLVLSGKGLDSRDLYEIADKQLKDRFSQIQGVAQVNISGGQKREIHVIFDKKTVYENSLSLPMLLQLFAAQNFDLPGGYFKIDNQEYTVRLKGTFNDLETIRNTEIMTPFGRKKISQLARVENSGIKVREKAFYFDNKTKQKYDDVVRISLIKSPDGNAIQVANEIYKQLSEIKSVLPPSTELKIVNDVSIFTRSTVDDTISNVLLGVLFTSIVLLIFLHDIRSTIIVALSMPTSIIATFLLFSMFNMTINMMSLMGISVSVGVLVSNSVVVLENIFRHKQLGKMRKEAAYQGTSEVTVAVIAATLTNVVVFVPLANIESIAGEFLKELALAATFSTMLSLLMSFTLTPMLASWILPDQLKTKDIGKFIESILRWMEDVYRYILRLVLYNKLVSTIIVISGFALLVFTAGIFGSHIGSGFIPVVDDGRIKVDVELPEGYNLDATSDVLDEIRKIVTNHKEVEQTVIKVGKTDEINIGTNMSRMEVYLCDANDRNIGIVDFNSMLINELSGIPNAKIKVNVLEGIGSGEDPVTFYLMGQDLGKMEKIKEKIIKKIKDTPGLVNFDNSSRSGKPEITLEPKRDMLAQTGLTAMDLALTLRTSVEGIKSSVYRELGEEYDIMLMLEESNVLSPEDVGNIPIVSPMGSTYRLSELADIKFTMGYTKILHKEKFKAIMFSGGNAPDKPLGDLIQDVDKKIDELRSELPPGYRLKWSGSSEMQQELMNDMLFAFALAVILTYLLLAAILENFWQPVVILSTLPLALIGVFLFMYFSDTQFNISSMMGIIMLIGIVVNNAILILDYANQMVREENMTPKDALLQAGPTKLTAITSSTIAIIIGMLPLALGIGDAGKEFRTPLGVVSIGGLVASTMLTFFVVPAFYYITSKVKKKSQSTLSVQ